MITGIVVALPEELTTLTSKRIEKGRSVFIGDTILVACSGTGPYNARSAAELLVSKGAAQLISWGCAAALSPALKPGDLTLVNKLIDADNNEMIIDSDWHRHTKRLLASTSSVHSGCLAESTSIVSSSEQKKQLHTITGAIAMDMESIAIAKVAKHHSLPFLAIRAIVDPVTMNLPRAIEYAANQEGNIVLSRLILFLILHPLELPQLIKLGIYFNAAKKNLRRVSKRLHDVVVIPKNAPSQPTHL